MRLEAQAMEAKEFAKFFGGFSTERRVEIMSALIEAGTDGISFIELSRQTDLSVIDIGNAAEALLLMDLIKISIKGENKLLIANFKLLDTLFEEAYSTFGPNRVRPPQEPVPQLTSDAQGNAPA